MSLLSMFFPRREVKTSADAAKERLQIVLSHERVGRGGDDFLPRLQRELVAVVARYVSIDPEKVLVHLDRGNSMSTLEIEIEVPAPTPGQVKKEALPAETSTEEKHIASA